MCEIDWAAFGTWAAVVLALGIAVADKVSGYFRRKRESLLLSILVLPALIEAQIRIERISAHVNDPGRTDGEYEAFIANYQELKDDLKQLGEGVDLDAIAALVPRLPSIDRELSIQLSRALVATSDIRKGAAAPYHSDPDQFARSVYEFFKLFREELVDAQKILLTAIALCKKHIPRQK